MAGGPLWQTQSGQEPEGRRWLGLGVGAVVLLAVLGALLLLSRTGEPRRIPAVVPTGEAHPYAAHLRISDVQMATATTFLGSTVYYIDGMLHNEGERTVTGMRMEATFYNDLDQVVQREMLRVLAMVQRVDHADSVDMSLAPIAAGEVGRFRLTLDHISADWNRRQPELRVVDVSLQ